MFLWVFHYPPNVINCLAFFPYWLVLAIIIFFWRKILYFDSSRSLYLTRTQHFIFSCLHSEFFDGAVSRWISNVLWDGWFWILGILIFKILDLICSSPNWGLFSYLFKYNVEVCVPGSVLVAASALSSLFTLFIFWSIMFHLF